AEVDGVLEPALGVRRAVRAAERAGVELVERPAGRLCGGTGGKERALRTERRLCSHVISPCRELARRWDRVARRAPYSCSVASQAAKKLLAKPGDRPNAGWAWIGEPGPSVYI